MACNENVIKNMASEVSRICQMKNVTIDVEFVIYLIELLLLNPKYGKLFKKTLNRKNLEFFVNECVNIVTRGDMSLNTLKMQFTMYSNYDKPSLLQKKYLDNIETCLRPLVTEIIEEPPDVKDDPEEFKKLYRKISIYIVLYSGLGNPSNIVVLKEGMAALESVFTREDLEAFVELTKSEKSARLSELVTVVSGVRLFNRDCQLTGESIPDLPKNLVDAANGCIESLSYTLVNTMQRINILTSACADSVVVDDETGNVHIQVLPHTDLVVEDYQNVYDLLSTNRQYEICARSLLSDTKNTLEAASADVARFERVLQTLHQATMYKAAVPTATVFPLFSDLWAVWRSMQCHMCVVSLINLLMQTLCGIQDAHIPPTIDKMIAAREQRDQERCDDQTAKQRASLTNLGSYSNMKMFESDKQFYYLGFCAVCIAAGLLTPLCPRAGVVRHAGSIYGFCSTTMAIRFAKDPQRYVNEVLQYARNNPHLINLLSLLDDVKRVRDVDALVVKYFPKIKISDKDIQTETHPIESHIEKNYSWDLWEWKRRACQWATITNCQTHSTQTIYSHLRSEIHCQTYELIDKTQQTKKDCGINTNRCDYFMWGLRGQNGIGQHPMNLNEPINRQKVCTASQESIAYFTPKKLELGFRDTLNETDKHNLEKLYINVSHKAEDHDSSHLDVGDGDSNKIRTDSRDDVLNRIKYENK